jgi:2-polyprenyl-6-methoxyphenol hydroxylase-like FAD-dependent oxidoreductase/NADPH:quinone reductase-like Zn-dependent oxidoreductase
MHIAVIGAGIGGLAVTIGLQQRGFEVSVFEQAPALTAVGAGLILAPNSHRLLTGEWGIDVVPGAVRPGALHLRRWQDGSTISEQRFGDEVVARFGSPYVAVHRADLLDALATRVRPDSLNLGMRMTDVAQNDDGAAVTFADGSSVRADLVIAADGTRSPSAAALGVPATVRASGYAAYRGLGAAELLDDLGDAHTAWLGPDRHFVHYPISGGRVLNFVAIVPTAREETESWTCPGDPADVRRHFAGWDPRVQRVLAEVDSVTLWGLYDRPVRDRLDFGRVVLLGDAAHAVLPFFAQGASMALEDAAVLSCLLAAAPAGRLDQALSAYSRIRVPRVRKVQDVSFRNATMFHLADGPQQRQRDLMLGDPASPDPLRANAWLYGHDVRDDVAAARAGFSPAVPASLPGRRVAAAVIDAPGADPRVQMVTMPERPAGHTLLQVVAAPLNPLDLLIASGRVPSVRHEQAYVPGIECVGTVLASERFAAGTLVYAECHASPLTPGACSTHVVVPDADVLPLPPGVDAVDAAAVGNAGTAAFMPLVETAGLRDGETVLVLGATGAVGGLAVQIARRCGAARVVGVGRDPVALDRLAVLGADAVVALRPGESEAALGDRLSAATGMADIVLDGLYGIPLQAALHACAPRARVVNIGNLAGSAVQLPAGLLRGQQLTVTGFAGLLTPLQDKRRALTWLWDELAQGDLQVEVRTFSLTDLPAAWAAQADSPHAKCVILPQLRSQDHQDEKGS